MAKGNTTIIQRIPKAFETIRCHICRRSTQHIFRKAYEMNIPPSNKLYGIAHEYECQECKGTDYLVFRMKRPTQAFVFR